MSIQEAGTIFVIALISFLIELLLYFALGMNRALHMGGLPMVVAYKFLWLTAMTFFAGFLAPVSAVFESLIKRKAGWWIWILSVFLAMIGFTVLSFSNAVVHHKKNIVFDYGPVADRKTLSEKRVLKLPVPGSGAETKISEAVKKSVEWVRAEADQPEKEQIRLVFTFKNKTAKSVSSLDYTFTSQDESGIFMKTNMRENFRIEPGQEATRYLSFKKSTFHDPEKFSRLENAFAHNHLNVKAVVTRVVFEDGTAS